MTSRKNYFYEVSGTRRTDPGSLPAPWSRNELTRDSKYTGTNASRRGEGGEDLLFSLPKAQSTQAAGTPRAEGRTGGQGVPPEEPESSSRRRRPERDGDSSLRTSASTMDL